MKCSALFWTVLLVLSFGAGARGAVLLAWDAQGFSSSSPWPENWSSSSQGGTVSVASGILVDSGLGRGAGTSLAALNNGWGVGAINQTSLSGAVTDGDYVSFALSPQAGYGLSLAGLDFTVRLPEAGWNAGTSRYQWQYKIGNGSFVDIGSPLALSGIWDTNGVAQPALDLSGISALQNITAPVEFRLYAWGTGGQFVFGRQSGNDLAVNGTVFAVPEPGRAGLLGAAVFALLASRRRRCGRMPDS